MPGPPPKPEGARARRNKTSTAAVLVANPDAEVPPLPERPPTTVIRDKEGEVLETLPREWAEPVREAWAEIWRSPMASQYLATDKIGLLQFAVLLQEFHTTEDPDRRRALHAEIRQTRRDFGLTPMARATLHWAIATSEEAGDRLRERRRARANNAPRQPFDANATAEDELAALQP